MSLSFQEKLACALHGMDFHEFTRAKNKSAVLDAEGADFHREICKIAHAVFVLDGEGNSTAGKLFEKVAFEKEWHPAYLQFSRPVISALTRYAHTEHDRESTKSAAALLPALAAGSEGGGGVSGALRTLVGAGILGGSALGGLGFLLSRDARQSSAESAELLEKVRAYKQLRKDIEDEMAASGALDNGDGSKDKATERYDY